MINREIPFRPRLEGEFRIRFYNAASEITEKTPTLTIAKIAEREIEWVEKDCQYNIEQRKKYRAVWFLFRDLIRASWKACYRNGVIYMSLPTLNGIDMNDTASPEVKALLRSWMSESRHERLVGYTDFINRMENPGANKKSIATLIADGDELEKRIKRVHAGEITIETAVQPYLQLVRENDRDLIEDLSQMPHMLVGGSTGSGKSVFLFSMLAALLMTHPKKEDMQLILSSSKLEDFIHFEGLPHLYSGRIISDAVEATKVIKEVIFEESERRGRLLAEARVANIIEYNKKVTEKLAPIVVVIDEFADLADQLETAKEKNAFYKPVQRIAQTGRSRGIHLVICTQRPEAKLVPSTTKAQLNGRVALRVNDGISSRMIIEEPDAQYLQKHGDMIYRNGDVIERAQGYLIEIDELDKIVDDVIHGRI